MPEDMQPQPDPQSENGRTPNGRKLGTSLVLSIVILSVLAGAAAGGGAALYLTRQFSASSGIFQTKTSVSEDSAIIDVVNKASPAVVSIVASEDVSQFQADNTPNLSPYFLDPFFQFRGNSGSSQKNTQPQYQAVSAGSGFFVTADGLILTNKHVVSGLAAKYAVFTSDGKKYDATVAATDPLDDLALVKINITNAPFLTFADSSKIKIGQRVIAIGNSLGQYSNTVTSGIVSGIGRDVTAGGSGVSEQLEGVVQTDAAINPGNSGGPLLNIFGDVVGVNTAIDQQGQLVGFAIPANDADTAVNSYEKLGKIVRPFLGVRYVLIDDSVQQDNKLAVNHGAWVTAGQNSDGSTSPAVVAGSAADKAGIKDGDIILSVNGQQIEQHHTLASLIKQFNPGDKVSLQVMRGKDTITVSVTLDQSK